MDHNRPLTLGSAAGAFVGKERIGEGRAIAAPVFGKQQ